MQQDVLEGQQTIYNLPMYQSIIFNTPDQIFIGYFPATIHQSFRTQAKVLILIARIPHVLIKEMVFGDSSACVKRDLD